MEPLLVIANAEAGNAEDQTLASALAILAEYGAVEVKRTSSANDLTDALLEAGSRWIVVAGGDGSLHAVVQDLHTRGDLAGRVIGLLPLGTGNDFARGAGIPLEVEAAARLITASEPRSVDLIVDGEDQVVVNNVHIGAGAQASRRGARLKSVLGRFGLGKAGYPIGAAVSALDDSDIVVQVYADQVPVTRGGQQVLMVAVGIGSSVGGGTELTPHARVGDGLADVMVSFATAPRAKLGYLVDLVRARHPSRDDVVYLQATSVTVDAAEGSDGFWASADGEISGPHSHAEWRLLPGSHQMLLPPG